MSTKIDTNTHWGATAYPLARKIAFINGKFWAFYNNGSAIEYSYSADGETWASGGTTTGASYFSIWADTSNKVVYLVRRTSGTYYVRKGTVGATSISWGDETSIVAGGEGYAVSYPIIVQDTSGYIHVFYGYINAEWHPVLVVKKSTSAHDISAFGDAVTIAESTEGAEMLLNAVPLLANKLYCTYEEDGTGKVHGKLFDESWGDAVEIWPSGGATTRRAMALVANGDVIHSLKADPNLAYKKYSAGSWGTAVTLKAGATPTDPTISLDAPNNQVYAFWTESNAVMYRIGSSPFGSGDWASEVTLEAADGLTQKYLCSGYADYGSETIYCIWTEGTGSPYDVEYDSISAPAPEPPEGLPGLNPALAQVVFG